MRVTDPVVIEALAALIAANRCERRERELAGAVVASQARLSAAAVGRAGHATPRLERESVEEAASVAAGP